MRATLKIFRYNPETKERARYDAFDIEVGKGKTILDCLVEIQDNKDSTLAFEGACNNGICGGCAVRINGKPRLACHTQALECLKDRIIVVEPLPNLPIIKDLAVDKSAFWNSITRTMPYLVHKEQEEKGSLITDKQEAASKDAEKCIMCSICYSICTAVKFEPSFLGPAAAAKAYRFFSDARDAKKAERLELLNKENIWACTHQFSCTELCPKSIDPSERISDLKNQLILNKPTKTRGSRNTDVFYSTIKNYGRLDFRTWGIKAGMPFMSELMLNLRLLKKGRNSLIIKKIKNHSQLKKIFKGRGEK